MISVVVSAPCAPMSTESKLTVLKDVVERTGSTKEVTNDILNMHVATNYGTVINLKEREDVYGRMLR